MMVKGLESVIVAIIKRVALSATVMIEYFVRV